MKQSEGIEKWNQYCKKNERVREREGKGIIERRESEKGIEKRRKREV